MEKSPNTHSIEKENLWQSEKEIVDKITDKLGLEIDAGIKDAVIVLRLLGINTTASHEGKIDRYPVPYIDIESPQSRILRKQRNLKIFELRSKEEQDLEIEIENLYRQIRILKNQDEDKYNEIDKKIDELTDKLAIYPTPKNDETVGLLAKIRAENSKEEEKIANLLKLFYENRIPSPEAELIAEKKGFGVRLVSRGNELQDEEMDHDKKVERLKLFQDEMTVFTEFLKAKFFE